MPRFLPTVSAIFLGLGVVCLAALRGAQQASQPSARQIDVQPAYAGRKLIRPANYRDWVFLSSGLGMTYNAVAGGPEFFTNVFVPQWAYDKFLASGTWPQKAMFVLEERASENKGSINKGGHFQSDLKGLAVEVKDVSRFANVWAYFSFGGDGQAAEPMTGPKDSCWQCHNDNAAVEHTFVQFYPTLKPVAEKFGTYRDRADGAAPPH